MLVASWTIKIRCRMWERTVRYIWLRFAERCHYCYFMLSYYGRKLPLFVWTVPTFDICTYQLHWSINASKYEKSLYQIRMWYLAGGYSQNVHLYDLHTGRVVNTFKNVHYQHINVLKFANMNPSIFCTSSFDRTVKLWDLRESSRVWDFVLFYSAVLILE